MNPDGRKVGNWNLEISFFIEIGLLLLFLGGFIFMWLESLAWPPGAAMFPRIAATIGVLSVLAFGAQRVRQARNVRWVPAERILDLQWSTGDADAVSLRRRSATIVVSIAALWLGVWLMGFHVAIPLYLLTQLVLLGNMKWWSAALVSLAALGIIIGVYDELLQISWHEPVLKQVWQNLASY